ncbi:MAG: hypothetical protein DMF90_27970 [Acidobacteria bacterium]|nr:MAG: hypothetical protein DMF90_27970 [Acidobacteriota bacterium]
MVSPRQSWPNSGPAVSSDGNLGGPQGRTRNDRTRETDGSGASSAERRTAAGQKLAGALKASGYAFGVFTPGGSVRLASERVSEDYIELSLDTSGDAPVVLGHVSRARGRRIIETERPIATGPIADLSEHQVLDFFLKELEPFVER